VQAETLNFDKIRNFWGPKLTSEPKAHFTIINVIKMITAQF